MNTLAHQPEPSKPQRENDEQSTRDVSRPQLDLSRLRKIQPRAYLIRFLFGGVISVIALLIGHWTTQPFGGVFTAFPAILLASLTLIGKDDGKEQAAEDAEGGVLGAVAFVCAAIFITLTITHIAGIVSLLAALLLWALIAISLYLLCIRLGLLRTYQKKDQQQKQGGQNGQNGQQEQT